MITETLQLAADLDIGQGAMWAVVGMVLGKAMAHAVWATVLGVIGCKLISLMSQDNELEKISNVNSCLEKELRQAKRHEEEWQVACDKLYEENKKLKEKK